MKYPLVGGFYQDISRQFGAQRCINMFTTASDIDTSKEQAQLIGTPGKRAFSDSLTDVGCRGLYTATTSTNEKRLFGVFGSGVYEYDPVGSLAIPTLIGTLGTSFGPVSISDNGIVMCIVDGSAGFFFHFCLIWVNYLLILDKRLPLNYIRPEFQLQMQNSG